MRLFQDQFKWVFTEEESPNKYTALALSTLQKASAQTNKKKKTVSKLTPPWRIKVS